MEPLLQTSSLYGILGMTIGYIIGYGLSEIPLVTLTVVFIQILSFAGVFPDPWDCAGAPVPEQKVLGHISLWSLIATNLERRSHGLIFALIIGGFIRVGVFLEPMYGSVNFALLLGVFSLACGVIHLYHVFGWRWLINMRSMVGLTAVLIALQVLMVIKKYKNYQIFNNENLEVVLPLIVPIVYCIFVDKNSVFFHYGGIVVGGAYALTPAGALIDKVITIISGQAINWSIDPKTV